MDKLAYTAATGARATLARQDTVAQNLANASTPGYRAETAAYRSVPLAGSPTRVFALEATGGADFTPGTIQQTARPLDVAVDGPGWIAVELPGGGEAYTRAGNLQVSPEGLLQTSTGFNLAGGVTIPADATPRIGADGTVSATSNSNQAQALTLGQLKLVNPPAANLVKSADGLFRLRGGGVAPADDSVRLAAGALESSNVNPVDSLVSMIALARQFDLQMKMIQNAEANDREATKLLGVS